MWQRSTISTIQCTHEIDSNNSAQFRNDLTHFYLCFLTSIRILYSHWVTETFKLFVLSIYNQFWTIKNSIQQSNRVVCNKIYQHGVFLNWNGVTSNYPQVVIYHNTFQPTPHEERKQCSSSFTAPQVMPNIRRRIENRNFYNLESISKYIKSDAKVLKANRTRMLMPTLLLAHSSFNYFKNPLCAHPHMKIKSRTKS